MKLSTGRKSITLDVNKYYSFLRLLTMLKDICKDVDIRDGVLRQKSSDGFIILEIDLRYLINDLSIPLAVLSKKIDLLKTFQGQEVVIETTDKIIKISDSLSSFEFRRPSVNYIDNKFIPEDELRNIINIADEDLIMVTPISKTISDRIKVTSKVFEHNSIIIDFSNNIGNISMDKGSKDQNADFVKDISLDHNISGQTVLITTPFILDHDGEIIFKIFTINEKQALSEFKMVLDDINITIYHRSILYIESGAFDDED